MQRTDVGTVVAAPAASASAGDETTSRSSATVVVPLPTDEASRFATNLERTSNGGS